MSVKTTGNVTYNNKSYNLWQRERAIAHQAHVKNIITVANTTKTLTSEDSGAIVMMSSEGSSGHGDVTVTLPSAAEAGLNFKFVCQTSGPDHKMYINASPDTEDFAGVLFANSSGGNDDALDLDGTDNQLQFLAAAKAGDWIECEADGADWFCSGAGQGTSFAVTNQ